MEKIWTCQICGRDIKARVGVIAHHGYTRPGDGWQTPSCFGARQLPYEISKDIIPKAIESMRMYITGRRQQLKDFINNPPEKLSIQYNIYSTPKEVIRPADFDSKKVEERGSWPAFSYEGEYRHKTYEMRASIEWTRKDIGRLEKRLASWVEPTKETLKLWEEAKK